MMILLAGTSGAVRAQAPKVPETPEEHAKLVRLNAAIDAANAKIEAAKAEIAAKEAEKEVILAAIDKREGTHLAGENLPPPTLPEVDKLAARFAKFREDYSFMLRQSVFTAAGIEEPALFQYTMPAQGDNSWLADVGMQISKDMEGSNGERVWGMPSWKLMADYHYNDAAGALKDSFTSAAGLDLRLGSDSTTAQLVSLAAGYKRDNLVSGEGVTGSLTWFPSHAAAGVGEFKQINSWLSGRIVPYLGLELESGDGSVNFQDGDRYSASAGVTLAGELFPGWLGNRLEASVTFAYWNHFSTSGGYDAYDTNQHYFSGLVTYWLDRGKEDPETGMPAKLLKKDEKHFGLSAKYVKGDNPGTGEFDADVWTFGLSIMF